jgi:hypothetical protein
MVIAFRLFVTLAALFLASCTPGTKYRLFNNTAEEVELILVGESTRLASHEWTELKWTRNPLLIVRVGTRTLNYSVAFSYFGQITTAGTEIQLPMPPARWGVVAYCFQLEQNGDVYFVPCEASFPAEVPRAQPQGLPLRPIESKA